MSPTKERFIITTSRKVSVTDQIFYRWPGFNDPTVWRTFSSTVHSCDVRQCKRNTPKHRPSVEPESQTFAAEWQTPATRRKSPRQGTVRRVCFLWRTKPCLTQVTQRMTLRSSRGQERGRRSVARHSFKGTQWLIYTILLQDPLAIFYCFFVLCFDPVCCSSYQRSIHTTWTTTHAQCQDCFPISHLTFWFVLCYVIQLWHKQSNWTYDNIVLGQYVASWVKF